MIIGLAGTCGGRGCIGGVFLRPCQPLYVCCLDTLNNDLWDQYYSLIFPLKYVV
jgi:hypothetical protein